MGKTNVIKIKSALYFPFLSVNNYLNPTPDLFYNRINIGIMWRVWNSLAKGFRYNAASARNGALIPEEERDVSLSLWSKCDALKGHTSQCQQNYHTERNNVNKEVPSYKWKNCVDNASFLEIIGLSSALALGWQVSHFNWSNKTQPVPLEKRWSLQIPAFAQLNYPETRLNVLGKKHLSAKTAENSS